MDALTQKRMNDFQKYLDSIHARFENEEALTKYLHEHPDTPLAGTVGDEIKYSKVIRSFAELTEFLQLCVLEKQSEAYYPCLSTLSNIIYIKELERSEDLDELIDMIDETFEYTYRDVFMVEDSCLEGSQYNIFKVKAGLLSPDQFELIDGEPEYPCHVTLSTVDSFDRMGDVKAFFFHYVPLSILSHTVTTVGPYFKSLEE